MHYIFIRYYYLTTPILFVFKDFCSVIMSIVTFAEIFLRFYVFAMFNKKTGNCVQTNENSIKQILLHS